MFQVYGVLQGVPQGVDVWLAGPKVFKQPLQFFLGTAQVVPFHADTSAAFTFPGGQKFIQQMIQVGGETVLPLGVDQVDLLLGETHRFVNRLCLSVESRQRKHPLDGQALPKYP